MAHGADGVTSPIRALLFAAPGRMDSRFAPKEGGFCTALNNSRRGVAQHFDIPRVNLLRQGFLCYILAGFGMDSSF
jgi:hypothetical protein